MTSRAETRDQQRSFVTLVGYGRYGKLIVNKYMSSDVKQFSCLASVVDPTFGKDSDQDDDLALRTCNATKPVGTFNTFESWYKEYWTDLSEKDKKAVVIDVAVKPEVCLSVVSQFADRCGSHLRWMILPKPVVATKMELTEMIDVLDRNNIMTAIASQWAYSPLPKFIRGHLATSEGPNAFREVIVNFTKENGHSYCTHPPLLEVPHSLQILHSTGVLDFNKNKSSPVERVVTGTEDRVTIKYKLASGATIRVESDLDYRPTPEERQQGTNAARSDYQIRTMKMVGQDGKLILDSDFWVHFNKSGSKVLREGKVWVRSESSPGEQQQGAQPVREDQLGGMLTQIYHFINRSSDDFSSASPSPLTLKEYQAIAEEIMDIEEEWIRHVQASSNNWFAKYYQTEQGRPSLVMRRVMSVHQLA